MSDVFKKGLLKQLSEIKGEMTSMESHIKYSNGRIKVALEQLQRDEDNLDRKKAQLLEKTELLKGLQEQFEIEDEEIEVQQSQGLRITNGTTLIGSNNNIGLGSYLGGYSNGNK